MGTAMKANLKPASPRLNRAIVRSGVHTLRRAFRDHSAKGVYTHLKSQVLAKGNHELATPLLCKMRDQSRDWKRAYKNYTDSGRTISKLLFTLLNNDEFVRQTLPYDDFLNILSHPGGLMFLISLYEQEHPLSDAATKVYLSGEFNPRTNRIQNIQLRAYSTEFERKSRFKYFEICLDIATPEGRLLDVRGDLTKEITLAYLKNQLEDQIFHPLEQMTVLDAMITVEIPAKQSLSLEDVVDYLSAGPAALNRLIDLYLKSLPYEQTERPQYLVLTLDPSQNTVTQVDFVTGQFIKLQRDQIAISTAADLTEQRVRLASGIDTDQIEALKTRLSQALTSSTPFQNPKTVKNEDLIQAFASPESALHAMRQLRLYGFIGSSSSSTAQSIWSKGQALRLKYNQMNQNKPLGGLNVEIIEDNPFAGKNWHYIDFDWHQGRPFIKSVQGKQMIFDIAMSFFIGTHPDLAESIDSVSTQLLASAWQLKNIPTISNYHSWVTLEDFEKIFSQPGRLEELIQTRKAAQPDSDQDFNDCVLVYKRNPPTVSHFQILTRKEFEEQKDSFDQNTAQIHFSKSSKGYFIKQAFGNHAFRYALQFNKTNYNLETRIPAIKQILAHAWNSDVVRGDDTKVSDAELVRLFNHDRIDPVNFIWNQIRNHIPSLPQTPPVLWFKATITNTGRHGDHAGAYGIELTLEEPELEELSHLVKVKIVLDEATGFYRAIPAEGLNRANNHIIDLINRSYRKQIRALESKSS